MEEISINDNVIAFEDPCHDGKTYLCFKNSHGIEINGNRTIHMRNWTLKDLEDIVTFLTIQEKK